MAFLDNIVSEINSGLKSKLSAFETSIFSGIASQIARKSGTKYEFVPAEVNNDGNAKWITFDDINELSIYHRIANSAYQLIKDQSYGDGYTTIQQNYDIELVVMADKRKVGVSPDTLEVAISSNLVDTVILPGVSYVSIYPVSANHASKTIFSQEFSGVNYYLKPEHILFSIRYRVELRYQKGCISLCQCD